MKTKKKLALVVVGVVLVASGAYAGFADNRTPVEFFKGHAHSNGHAIGAPEHSGGLDRNGCHNASVPYHCH